MAIARRSILLSIPAALAGIGVLFGQVAEPEPPSVPIEGPPPPFDSGPRPRPNPRALLKENDKKLKHDADQLLQLAQDLKKEADDTDDAGVLSLSLIHKAEEVEKLARQIRGLAKAN